MRINNILWGPPREDNKCGVFYPANDEKFSDYPAGCNPEGPYPCCAPSGLCGKTADHCKCKSCTKFKKKTKNSSKGKSGKRRKKSLLNIKKTNI